MAGIMPGENDAIWQMINGGTIASSNPGSILRMPGVVIAEDPGSFEEAVNSPGTFDISIEGALNRDPSGSGVPQEHVRAQERANRLAILDELASQFGIGMATAADRAAAPAASVHTLGGGGAIQQNVPLFAPDFYSMLLAGASNALRPQRFGG